ncbi:MAG: SUMF1/EgtB/PvdO family nonheme iron enzyme [Alphaproteobacteria bacterium]|nr:SUMF1/EgtB/PvdO family nonheme iron enzyme [Alphaproteobacteria bacterium]
MDEAELDLGERYADLGSIGVGGMAVVHRVHDRELDRVLAMKIVRAADLSDAWIDRFLAEARTTAQLQHPNIVPVHDAGRLADGRVWFTMREVRGHTLGDRIRDVHEAMRAGTASDWTLRRLLTAFVAVCNAVAYAHGRGVVHRDLKPQNAMVGEHGEVYVLDWGIAKVLGAAEVPEPVHTGRAAQHATRMGQVTGTPAYMPPEQAMGRVDAIDARSDVYALGAILFEILGGHPPFSGPPRKILARVVMGDRDPLVGPGGQGLPAALVRVCDRAMALRPEDRHPTAAELARDLQDWLDGARRREEALAVVERALAGVGEAEALERRAEVLASEADALLVDVPKWAPEAEKAPSWAKSSEARLLRREAELAELRVEQGLQAALRIAPDLDEAHVALVERYRLRHAHAEDAQDEDAAARAVALLEAHARALPERHPVRTSTEAWIVGDGALTLVTEPPGAEVELYRYVEQNLRMVEVFERSLGRTPLHAVPVARGSYLCRVVHADCEPVRYPMEITRQGHWDGVPPGATEPAPVFLPPRGSLPDDAVYVPAGWFRAGGAGAQALPPGRVWCPGFVVHRFQITNRQYVAFLDDLVAAGREGEALRHAPRERSGSDQPGRLILSYEGGRFGLGVDADGDVWLPEWPVLMTDRDGAQAYLDWLAAKTGHAWRLPLELEWEKAARGVDGRDVPWGGAHIDPSWCCMADSHVGRRMCAVIDSYPVDTSPYGMRGAGGNVQDWCFDGWDDSGRRTDRVGDAVDPGPDAYLPVRGGAWHASSALLSARGRAVRWLRDFDVSFRGLYRLG